MKKKLADDFPAVPLYRRTLAGNHNNLGRVLHDLGKRDEARRQYEKALDLLKKLADEFPAVPAYQRELARTHHNLGLLLTGQGKRDEAKREYEKALNTQQQLADAFPAVPEYQQNLANTHHNLGMLLADLGKREEARREYEAALGLQKQLADASPAVPEYQQNLANTHHNLGMLLADLGKREEARREFEAALGLKKPLADASPAVPGYWQELANAHNSLGMLLADLGKRDEARAEHEKALGLRKKLADAFPSVPDYQVDLGGGYCNLGILVSDEGKPADSLPWFDLAIRTLAPAHEKDPRAVTAKQFLRNSLWNRARAYDQLKKHAEAIKDWDRAIELSLKSEQPSLRLSRANSLVQSRHEAEAVAEAEELTKEARVGTPEAPKWLAAEWYNFACVYAVASGKVAGKEQEYADRAVALLRRAVEAGYRDAAHMRKDPDLDALRGREDFQKLLAELAPAKEKKP
jgi:tetratricopeptide (TPR) repeat protein